MRVSLAAIILLTVSQMAAAAVPQHVRADLVCDMAGIRPGQPFMVGVLLKIDPGWHIYWTNPGDSGMATSVRFELPAGFTAGQVEFPVPQCIALPGNLVNYGYEDEVMLLTAITPPADLRPGQQVKIAAAVKFLCCEKVCLPGAARPELALTVDPNATRANVQLIEKWRARVPIEVRPGERLPIEMQTATSRPEPGGVAEVVINWKQVPKEEQVFPTADESVSASLLAIRTAGRTSTIALKIEPLAGHKTPPAEYPIVIGYINSAGEPRGIIVHLSIPQRSVKP